MGYKARPLKQTPWLEHDLEHIMYAIFDKLIAKFSKKKQQPIEELIEEDYEPQMFHEAYEEVEFNPSHV